MLFILPLQSFIQDYQQAQIYTTIEEDIEYNEFDQVGDGRKLRPDIIPAEQNYVEDERQRRLQEIQGQSGYLSSILRNKLALHTRQHSSC